MYLSRIVIALFLGFGCCTAYSQVVIAEADASQKAGQPAQWQVRSIAVSGNRITRDPIVFREVALKSGECYSPAELQRRLRLTQEQLMNTALFVKVDVKAVEYLAEAIVDVDIVVDERWYLWPVPFFRVIDRNWNVWINDYKASLERVNFGAKLSHNNVTGRNDKLNLWIIGGYTQQLEFKYQLPFVDRKMEKGFTVGLSVGRNRELNYATDSNRQQFQSLPNFGRQYLRAEATFSHRKGSQQRFYLRSIFGQEKIDSAFYYLNPKYLAGRTRVSYFDLLANYQYFNVDFIPFPLRGWYVDFWAQQRFSNTLGMFSIGGRALATWSFMPKTYINFQTAFQANVPKQEAFYNQRLMGYGSLWMQGLEYYVADGDFGVMGRTTLRRELFTYTFKGPQKWKTYSRIPFRVFAKAFGNLGYAYNPRPGTNFMNNRLLRTGGFGLEIATIYDMVFKIDYSFNQFGESGIFIHTSADF
ncbi:MAG: hypothetical protein MUF62_04875 [Chitinophagaceae bacterium]|nr:hypothetical protein [Chitinophagaceae bacterium]